MGDVPESDAEEAGVLEHVVAEAGAEAEVGGDEAAAGGEELGGVGAHGHLRDRPIGLGRDLVTWSQSSVQILRG